MEWGLEHAPDLAVRLAGPLGDYWSIRQDPDGLRWVDAALVAATDQPASKGLAFAHLSRAYLLGQRRDLAGQGEAARVALGLSQTLGDEAGIAAALCCLAANAMKLDDVGGERAFAEAACRHARAVADEGLLGIALARLAEALPSRERLPVLEQARDLLQRVGNYRQIAHAFGTAAYMALLEGRPAEALTLLEAARAAAQTLQDPGTHGLLVGNLGLAHLLLGDISRAREEFTQEVVFCAKQAFRYGVEEGLAGLAAIAAHEGASRRAARLLGASRGLGRWLPGDAEILARLERDYFADARARIGSDAWRQGEREGAAMSYEEAIAYALREPGPPDPQPTGSAPGGPDLRSP